MLVMERIRLFRGSAISLDTIVRLAQMVGTIIDHCDAEAFAIDTRSWKSAVLGKANASKDDAVSYINNKYKLKLAKTRHDMCDALCIAEASFIPKIQKALKKQS